MSSKETLVPVPSNIFIYKAEGCYTLATIIWESRSEYPLLPNRGIFNKMSIFYTIHDHIYNTTTSHDQIAR